jgi:hypothetical protein
MKMITQFLKFSGMMLFWGMLLLTCTDEPEANPEPKLSSDTLTVEDLDDLSDHLQFFSATKKEGKTPAAPTSSSLKFSIKDTLHLGEGVLMPIKFLHDELTNVAGVYIQVHGPLSGGSAGTFATNYYDVPEELNTAESDTVSIIVVGFDPADFEFPLSFDITIAPYDEGGQLIDETEVPVVIEDINDPNNSSSGSCGVVLPQGSYWDWFWSYDSIGKVVTDPFYVAGGDQIIKGCCVGGISDYGILCLSGTPEVDLLVERSLPFPTYYQIAAETFIFFDNGTYTRFTQENSANPLPSKSDFCNGDIGIVDIQVSKVTYGGNWTITKNVPTIPGWPPLDNLTLQGTSKTIPGGGYGNPGGFLVFRGCDIMDMLQVSYQDGEYPTILFKKYVRRQAGEDEWYLLS